MISKLFNFFWIVCELFANYSPRKTDSHIVIMEEKVDESTGKYEKQIKDN